MDGRRADAKLVTQETNLVKLVGPVNWCPMADADHGRVTRAILRDDRTLAVDMQWGGYVYSATLTRDADGSVHGVWTYRATSDTETVIARLFESAAGNVLLGEWTEDGTKYHWWAELAA